MTCIVIGGGSSVGKTTTARRLSLLLKIPHGPPEGLSGDRRVDPLGGGIDVWQEPARELCHKLILAAALTSPRITEQVMRLAMTGCSAIVEGERVHVDVFDRLEGQREAHVVFIVEADVEQLHATLWMRSRGFRKLDQAVRWKVAEVDRLFNLWILEQVTARAIPWVPSQPWTTLPHRVLQACLCRGGAAPAPRKV